MVKHGYDDVMVTRAEKSEVRRDTVLQATSELLDELGIAALTVRQVAERAGVAQGSVFLYADSKAHLVNQVFGTRIARRWHLLLDDLASQEPLDRVEQFYLGCVDIFYNDLENVQAFYREMARSLTVRLDIVEDLLQRIRDALTEAKQHGHIRSDVDVEVLAYSYQGLYSNVIELSNLGRTQIESRRIIGESMRQLRYGVVPLSQPLNPG